jgi:endoglucanase
MKYLPSHTTNSRNEKKQPVHACNIPTPLAIWMTAFIFLSISGYSKDASAYVRVNLVGYQLAAPIRAYLMATGSESGAKFVVKNSNGETSYSAVVGSELGTWGTYSVDALDFTITVPGTYTVVVASPISATSPAFKVDRPANLYSLALTNGLKFFQNQRDGPNFIPSALRAAPAHLNDRHGKVYRTPEFSGREGSRIKGDLTPTGAVIDASGGWWDAGDCLKFVETASYAVALMLVGVRDFPDQMGKGSNASNFSNEARFGLDWLQCMWDDNSQTLYYQVGIGSWGSGFENDHSIWRLPQADDTFGNTDPKYRYIRNRPVFIAGSAGSKISPNLAGRLAGDFALCSRVYHASDAVYANRCLLSAEHVFDLADTAPTGNLLTAGPHDFYPESEWRGDMEFGATELYLATLSVNLPAGLPHNDPVRRQDK